MQKDVSLTERFEYDGAECLRLYMEYLEGRVSMDDFLRYLKRHIILRIRRCYMKRVKGDVCEDLVQAALIELWHCAEKKSIPIASVAVFHSYVNTVLHRRSAKTFREVYDDAPKSLDPSRYSEDLYARLPDAEDAENSLFGSELPAYLKERVLARIWGPGENMLGAAGYVLDQVLVHHERVVPAWLKRHYDLADPDFLVEKVLIMLKQELYKVKRDIKFRTNAEKREILHEGLEDYLADVGGA